MKPSTLPISEGVGSGSVRGIVAVGGRGTTEGAQSEAALLTQTGHVSVFILFVGERRDALLYYLLATRTPSHTTHLPSAHLPPSSSIVSTMARTKLIPKHKKNKTPTATARKKQKAPKAPIPPKEKRHPGNQGGFFGRRYQFLSSHLDEYYQAADAGTTSEFFDKYIPAYWEMFPWRLARDEEPVEGAEYPTTDDEDFNRKKVIMQDTNRVRLNNTVRTTILTLYQSLKQWWRFRQTKRRNEAKNPWTKLLDGLYREAGGVAPRALPPWQLFMSVEHELIMKEYDLRFPGRDKITRARDINRRAQIAREMFVELSEDEQDEYEEDCRRMHVAAQAEAEAMRQAAAGQQTTVDVQS